ncbi:MAG: tetratricopeptide repeat protein [Trueperaceae bacterium]|nr:tetratricopeptide repeat protein [Trueperaceae bacterium]
MKQALLSAKLLLMIVVLLLSQALGQASVDSLRQAALNDPQNLDAWIELGNAYLEQDNFDLAAESFYEATSLDYRSGEAHFGMGLAEYGRGDYPAALFEFSEVSRLYPERFDGHFNRAVTLTKLLQPEEAVAAFQEAISQAKPEASKAQVIEAELGLAGQYKLLENYAAAAEAYSAALELDPENQETIFQRADSLYQAGRGLEALADLSELESSTTDYRVSSLIADIYIQQDQTEYALRSLERAMRRLANSGDAKAQANILVKLGILQRQLDREAEAMASFQRATTVDPNLWQAYYNLGLGYLDAEQPQNALPYFEQARNLNPDSVEAYIALASIYEQQGQFAQAADAAENAISRLEEDDPQILSLQALIGRTKYSQGDYQTALEMFDEVLSSNADDANTQLWAGLAAYYSENYTEAVSYLEKAVQLDDSSVEAKANLGAAYFKEERYKDAAFVYQMILDENPRDAEALYNLGLSLYAQGLIDEAKASWQESGDLGYSLAKDALQQYY